MKQTLALLTALCVLTACGEEGRAIFASVTPAPKGTPVPQVATPTPAPTPKPGNWMWDKYKNSLDEKSKPRR